MGKNNFGGSVLASHDSSIYGERVGLFGILKIIPLNDLEEHALLYRKSVESPWSMLAVHPNGYSVKNLAERIIEFWERKRDEGYVMEQFDFILRCGGLGRSQDAIKWILMPVD